MTRNDLVKELEKAERRSAREKSYDSDVNFINAKTTLHIWDTAYAAGAKDEREACAKVIEDWDLECFNYLASPRAVADAIRARGEK